MMLVSALAFSSVQECTSVANLITLCLSSLPRGSQSTQTRIFSTKSEWYPTSGCSVHGSKAEDAWREVRGAERSGMHWYSDRSVPVSKCLAAYALVWPWWVLCWCWQQWAVARQPSTPGAGQTLGARRLPRGGQPVLGVPWRGTWAWWHRDGGGHRLGIWPAAGEC